MKVYLRFFSFIPNFLPVFFNPCIYSDFPDHSESYVYMFANPYSRFRFPFHFNVYLMVILFSEGRQRRVSRQAVEELSHHLGQRVGTRYNKIFLPMPCLNLEIEIMPEKYVKREFKCGTVIFQRLHLPNMRRDDDRIRKLPGFFRDNGTCWFTMLASRTCLRSDLQDV